MKGIDQIGIVCKVLKAFPKDFKIDQNLYNQIIGLVDEVIAYNKALVKGVTVSQVAPEGESTK